MLKVWLPLNGDLHNQGCSNYTIGIARGSETYNNSGKIGKCFYSNGVNTLKITNIIPDIYNYSSYSLSAWFYVETNNTSHTGSSIISGGNWNGQLLNLAVSNWSTDHYTKLRISGSNWTRTYNYDFYKNTWYHAVVCDDGTHTYGYVNGILIGNTAASFLPSSIEGNDIYIGGATYSTSMQFFGKINDIRIYDHCLSAAEVKEISQGLVLHYKLDQSNPNLISSDIFNSDPWKSAIAAHEVFQNRLAYRLSNSILYSKTGNGANDLFSGNITYQANTQYTLSITWRDDYRTDNKSSSLYLRFIYSDGSAATQMISPANSIHEWKHQSITSTAGKTVSKITTTYGNGGYLYITDLKLEVGVLDTGMLYTDGSIEDSSGYNYNGTILGNPVISSDTARYISSTSFPSNVDGILSTYPLTLWNNAFTYSFWIKPSGENGGRSVYAASYSGTTCSIEKTTGNKLRFYWNGSPDLSTSSLTITDGTWQHIAIVKEENKTTVKCYYNGILKDTFTNTFSDKAFSGNLRIARDTRGDATSYTGLMSDFRIYCTALSADDILQLYHTSAKIDNKKNLHTYELIENSSSIKINKRGQTLCNELQEGTAMKFYKTDSIIETNVLNEF